MAKKKGKKPGTTKRTRRAVAHHRPVPRSAKRTIFEWKAAARVKANPSDAAEVFEEIRRENGGVLPPKAVVQKARKRRSPIHEEFIWDNEVAGELQRIDHARYLIRSLVEVVQVEEEEEVKTFKVRVYSSTGDGLGDNKASQYRKTRDMLSDREQRRKLLMKAFNKLLALKREYEDLHELGRVWDAVDALGHSIVEEL